MITKKQINDRLTFVSALGIVSYLFTQKALKLQSIEYDRRLYDLNNSHARLDEAVSKNVSSDTWNSFVDTYKTDGNRHVEAFEQIHRFQNKILGAIGLALIFVPLLTAVVVYILTRHSIPASK